MSYKPFCLYIKTHNTTGMKYFGYTSKDPFEYKGSGKYWLRHLSVHGNDVTTKIFAHCKDLDEVSEVGLMFSKQHNIVESSEWANLKEESGTGGDPLHDSETCRKISQNHAPCSGKDNSNFIGWYVTPWGTFDTVHRASNVVNGTPSASSIRRYCRNNKRKVSKEVIKMTWNGKKTPYFTINEIGKTFEDLGFSFIPKSQDDSKLD